MRFSLGFGWLAALALVAGCSCGDGGTGTEDTGVAPDAPIAPLDAPITFDAPFTDDAPGLDAPFVLDDAPPVPADAGPPDAFTPECAAAADCMTLHGAPPCGTWTCTSGLCAASCPGCADADGDGYGAGAPGACAGPDCDDADRTLGSDGMRACYSGPAGTAGVGTCREGVEICAGGVLAPCSGEVFPSGEACNAEDDDCDGTTDESLGMFSCGLGACATSVAACTAGAVGMCTAPAGMANDSLCNRIDDDCDGLLDEDCSCVHVTPSGNDAMAIASGNTTPFATIQAAIDWAAMDATRPRTVCVASGATCGAGAATFNGAVTMADGISVLGRYEATTWTRCASAAQPVIAPGVAEGVRFPDTIAMPTVLGGFRVDRHTAVTTAAITVDGATSVTITDVLINNTPAATSSYGVDLRNGAEATISRSSIYAGNGSSESIGIRSIGSRPTILDNCQGLDANGRCDDFCGSTNLAIRGRFTGPGTGTSYGVLLQDSPGALIQGTAICGMESDRGAGVYVTGDAAGTVIRTSLINAWGGAVDLHGVWLADCGGAAPWIVDNFLIAAAGDTNMTRVDGVRAMGDCHPIVDSNVRITGGGEGGASGANGVYCGAAGGRASACVVVGNTLIEGSSVGFPPTAVGVRCDDGGCLRIADNVIDGRGGVVTEGVHLGVSGTVVERNVIRGGCATMSGTGIVAVGSHARLENNFISAGTCPAGAAPGTMATWTGLSVSATAGPAELDVHSNVIDGRGVSAGGCTSRGLAFVGSSAGGVGPEGVFRNNILRGGDCGTASVVAELAAGADPRVFENNDLDPYSAPMSLYVDESSMALTTVAAVNALADARFAGNVSFDAAFVAYPNDLHVTAGSMCLGMGTAAGAPSADYDGDPRDVAAPDIGADER